MRIIAFPLHLSSWNYTGTLPMSQGWALLTSGVPYGCRGQKVKVTMQWLLFFMAHNCFPFTSAIIKLHAQIPCESRICLTDIGVKNVESLNWLPRGVFVPLGQPHSSICIDVNDKHRVCPSTVMAQNTEYFGLYRNQRVQIWQLGCRCYVITRC